MHTAKPLYTPSPAFVNLPYSAALPSTVICLDFWDDPKEWATFSRSANDLHADEDIWESEVIVGGMHCALCALNVEQALLGTKGVAAARVSAASERASVTWSAALTRPSLWMSAAQALGYPLTPVSEAFSPNHSQHETRLALWRWLVAGFCMMQVMMYAIPGYFAAQGEITPDIVKLLRWASWILSLPVVIFSCGPFFRNAFRDLKHRNISMDLPVALGIAISFAVSTAATFEPQGWWGYEVYFDSLTMFVFFLLTGRWLEQRMRDRTAGELGHLMQRIPDSVERQSVNGFFERVAARRLNLGDIVRVLPGEAFPADGTVVLGDTFVDEALLTGESRPVSRPVGDPVMAGSYNLSTSVHVRIEKIGKSTRYAQIVALMQKASVDKPRLAALADRIAKPFLYFVILAALSAAIFWWPVDPARGLIAAVAVLVVTCPCALSLASPVSMLTAAGWLAKQGVLVRRLQAIESLAAIDTVIFDKTGTLTQTKMGLHAVHTREGISQAQALQLAAALAQHSLHPISQALTTAQLNASQSMPVMADVKELVGLGLEGKLAQPFHDVSIGSIRLGSALFCGVQTSSDDAMQVVLADAAGWIAQFDLNEVIRPDAQACVAALVGDGIEVQMLSGDRTSVAQCVADSIGIDKVLGDCTPQTKLTHLQTLQDQGRKVMMVGDGLNDGPVLARAHVSVALGNAVPLAQSHSDLIITGAQLQLIPSMLHHARRTMNIVRQNLWWAAIYNAVCVPLAIAGLLPAWLAGLGMATSSLLVLANATRISRPSKIQARI